MKQRFFTNMAMVALFAIVLTLGIGASLNAGQTVTLKGSDTMLMLGQRWAEAFMAGNPSTIIQVTGGGSGVGFAALINGSTDICEASRSIKPGEIDKLKQRFNSQGVEIPVARDGLAVYLNAENPVGELTVDQLRLIYLGTITNWKEVGGPDQRIILYGRENSSGTYSFFKDNVLKGKDFAAQTQTLPGTAAVVNAVAKDKFGIGYGGAAYAKGVKYAKAQDRRPMRLAMSQTLRLCAPATIRSPAIFSGTCGTSRKETLRSWWTSFYQTRDRRSSTRLATSR